MYSTSDYLLSVDLMFQNDYHEVNTQGGIIMEKVMFGCPHCETTFAGENKGKIPCPDCGFILSPLNVSEKSWDGMNQTEKDGLKEKLFTKFQEKEAKRDHVIDIEMKVNQMADDIRLIRNIMLISISVSATLFFIVFIASLAR